MNLGRESPLESEIDDFAEILRPTDATEPPVVVGGHAAGLWSRYFLSRGVTELVEFLPFRSKDLDLVGTTGLLDHLHRRFKGTLLRSEPRSPVFGRLDIPQTGGGFLRVEVLHTVLGLDAKDMKRTVDINVAGPLPISTIPLRRLRFRVIDPGFRVNLSEKLLEKPVTVCSDESQVVD